MLWYKAWLETRSRFLIALVVTTGLCVYRVYDLDRGAMPWSKIDYYYFALRSGHQLLTVTWTVAMTLLMMGGLLQEKGAGVSALTLVLPVSRRRLMGVRICAGLVESAVLAVIPWIAMFVVAALTGQVRSFRQVGFYLVLLAGGGAVFAGVATLVSSLIEGTYTAPMVSLGIVIACGNAPKSLDYLNPLDFMGGRNYIGPSSMLMGPVPWVQFAANVCVAAFLILLSVKVIERRDF